MTNFYGMNFTHEKNVFYGQKLVDYDWKSYNYLWLLLYLSFAGLKKMQADSENLYSRP